MLSHQLILHFFTVDSDASVGAYDGARCATDAVVGVDSLDVRVSRYIDLLVSKCDDAFVASFNAEGAAFASVCVYQDLTFDFTHNNLFFTFREAGMLLRVVVVLVIEVEDVVEHLLGLYCWTFRVECDGLEVVVQRHLPVALASVFVAFPVVFLSSHLFLFHHYW